MTVKAGALCTSIPKTNVFLKCAILNALTSLFLLPPPPLLSFLHFFKKETCLAAITALTVRDKYCFTKVACLLALYIKRARANIIQL